MEISAHTMASREMALNKATTNQDILLKTREKSAELEQTQTDRETRVPEVGKQVVPGRIDIYA